MRPSRGTVLRFANEGGLPERADWCGCLGISPLAIQMAVALAVSFVIGYVYFAERWTWIVLTAFIVGSGNRGRLDVAYKSVLRALGYAWWALFVTLALALLQGFAGSSAPRILWPRLEEIVIRAIIGVASTWLVLPVRSTAALRLSAP